MYKVQLFMDGTIRTVDKISLVKGLPNKSNRKAMNRNLTNQKANPVLKTKTGNK